MPTKTCKHCGKEFQPRTKRGCYCPGPCMRAKELAYGRHRYATFSPVRRKAIFLATQALERGNLKPQPCEVCGSKSFIVAHHDDYAKPLDVRWLCRTDHKHHHHQHGPGRNA